MLSLISRKRQISYIWTEEKNLTQSLSNIRVCKNTEKLFELKPASFMYLVSDIKHTLQIWLFVSAPECPIWPSLLPAGSTPPPPERVRACRVQGKEYFGAQLICTALINHCKQKSFDIIFDSIYFFNSVTWLTAADTRWILHCHAYYRCKVLGL